MKHSKRYAFIFHTWSERSFKTEQLEFDSLKELNETIALYDEIYKPTEPTKDKFGNEKKWGYAAVDFDDEKILKYGGDGLCDMKKHYDKLRQKDYFFRGEDEIPKKYKWDEGEYDGWLQFRWGDGKNAIGYVDKPKKKMNKTITDETIETSESDLIQDDFDRKLVKAKIQLKLERW